MSPPPNTSTKEVEQARNNRQKVQQKLSKKRKKISGNGSYRTLPLPNNNFATILSDDKAVVLSDTIRIPGAFTPNTGALSVSSLDVFEMLQKGLLLNDNVVQGYINLLGSAFGSSHGVRVVNTHFFNNLEREGWGKVSRWM